MTGTLSAHVPGKTLGLGHAPPGAFSGYCAAIGTTKEQSVDSDLMTPSVASPRSAAAPGWYPDPAKIATRRYWDGARWTHQVSPMSHHGTTPSPTHQAVAEERVPLPRWSVVTSVLVLTFGVIVALAIRW